jgi:hypothetical protein
MTHPHTSPTSSDITEPPSRRSQLALVEALATAVVDGKFVAFLCMLCGYTRYPLLLLIIAKISLISLILISYPLSMATLLEQIPAFNSEYMPLIVGIIMQGVGYGIAEIIQYQSTKFIKHRSINNYVYPVLIKNSGLAVLCLVGQLYAPALSMENFFYGGLYAMIIGTLQDFVLATPHLKYITQVFVKKIMYLRHHVPQILFKRYIFHTVMGILLIATPSLYAWSWYQPTPLGASPYLIFGTSIVTLLEQTIIYEYAYRMSYWLSTKIYAVCAFYMKWYSSWLWHYPFNGSVLDSGQLP